MDAARGKLSDIIPGLEINGFYKGTVVDTADPLYRGRVRVRIFGIHTAKTIQSDSEGIPDNHLPWAEQVAPCAGGSSGFGIFAIPEEGSIVTVFFLNGNHMFPVYMGTYMGMTASGGGGGGSGDSCGAPCSNEESEEQVQQEPIEYTGVEGCIKLLPDGRVDVHTVPGYSSIIPQNTDMASMHPVVLTQFCAMAAEYEKLTGKKIPVSEGFRSYDSQVACKKKYGNNAATPGRSNHGFGLAIDIQASKVPEIERNLAAHGIKIDSFLGQYGLGRPLLYDKNGKTWETWHIEHQGVKAATRGRLTYPNGKAPGSSYMTDEQKRELCKDENKE